MLREVTHRTESGTETKVTRGGSWFWGRFVVDGIESYRFGGGPESMTVRNLFQVHDDASEEIDNSKAWRWRPDIEVDLDAWVYEDVIRVKREGTSDAAGE